MRRPVIGIIGNNHLLNEEFPVYVDGAMNARAVAEAAGGLPLIVPANPGVVCLDEVMEVCDGFLFTGGRPNVHPEEYGEAVTPAHGFFDRSRDGLALPLIRACVARGQSSFRPSSCGAEASGTGS